MKITEIMSENLGACANLFAEVFNLPPWNEIWSENQAMERLEFYFNTPNFIGLSSYDGGELTDFIFGNYEPNQNQYLYFLKEMCVHPTSQGTGIGAELIGQLHTLLQSRNISTVNLLTQVNGRAGSFYLKNGYYKSTNIGLYIAKFNI